MASSTIFHYFLLLGIGSFLYLLFIMIADVFGFVQNIFLTNFSGIITEQTMTACNFCTGVIISAPFLVMLAIFLWAVIKGATN